jgi:hypothetical protein
MGLLYFYITYNYITSPSCGFIHQPSRVSCAYSYMCLNKINDFFTRHVAVIMQAENEAYSGTCLHYSNCITHHILVDSANITLNFGELWLQ